MNELVAQRGESWKVFMKSKVQFPKNQHYEGIFFLLKAQHFRTQEAFN
jgi:hypothetical protein